MIIGSKNKLSQISPKIFWSMLWAKKQNLWMTIWDSRKKCIDFSKSIILTLNSIGIMPTQGFWSTMSFKHQIWTNCTREEFSTFLIWHPVLVEFLRQWGSEELFLHRRSATDSWWAVSLESCSILDPNFKWKSRKPKRVKSWKGKTDTKRFSQ